MNAFEKEIQVHVGSKALEKIQAVQVGIAGAGGLGSNCAANLTRCGFRRFTIVDFDNVEFSNLNRQFFFSNQVGKPKVDMLKENLLAVKPDLELKKKEKKIDRDNINDFFDACDIIVEAFDSAEAKKMIIEAYAGSEKLMVSASGIAGWGKSDDIKIHRAGKNFFLIGDLISETTAELPPISPRVNIAAAKQADVILSHILGSNTQEMEI
ncbi:MAG: sulfur carrier protein ThiS adenylyltransferase ThiF [Deltaproteobacteria bacterium]|nr:sulfur carrier protein ThiS adenylyltransferase ThiF [Deltaproteobacteria bacterium]